MKTSKLNWGLGTLFAALFLCMGAANAEDIYTRCEFSKTLHNKDGGTFCYRGDIWWTSIIKNGKKKITTSFGAGIAGSESIYGNDIKGNPSWSIYYTNKKDTTTYKEIWHITNSSLGLNVDAQCSLTLSPVLGYEYSTRSLTNYADVYKVSKNYEEAKREEEKQKKVQEALIRKGSTTGLNVPGLPTPTVSPEDSPNPSPRGSQSGTEAGTDDGEDVIYPQGVLDAGGVGSCSVS